jgi:hypothetical protein
MEIEIKKSELDMVIQAERDYFNHEIGSIECSRVEEKVFGDESYWLSDILMGITTKRDTHDEPNETYYKVLEALGFEIIEG